MRYFKDIDNGYITAIGTGGNGVEITEGEYNQILAVVQAKPPRTETTDYRLKTNLTWEEYERPPEPEEDELDPQDALDMLFGGDAE